MILSQAAGFRGLNLQRACNAIFFGCRYSAEERENAEDRCHRIGSEGHERITYYDLVMKDSIDEVVLQALQEKKSVAEEILQHIRNRKD